MSLLSSFTQPFARLTFAIVSRFAPPEEIHIPRFTNIQSLHLSHLLPLDHSAGGLCSRQFITYILSQIPAQLVKDITFAVMDVSEDISPGNDDWKDGLDWCEVDKILDGPRFIALRRVSIIWLTWSKQTRPALEEFLELGPFASLSKRGLVNVEVQYMNRQCLH